MRKYYSLETAEKTATVVIFGDITSFPWMESDVSSYNLEQELEGLNVDNIEVHINSYGGEVSEALAIANTLMHSKAHVTTYVDGFACSAATIVFMAGDDRIMSAYSNFLIHPAWAEIEGNAEAMRREAENLDTITEQSIGIYTQRTGKSHDEIVGLMKQEKFLTPQQTLDWGFATAIDDAIANGKTATQSIRKSVYDKLRQPNKDDLMLEKLDKILKASETLEDLIKEKQEQDLKEENPVETTENNEPEASYMARFFNAMNSQEE